MEENINTNEKEIANMRGREFEVKSSVFKWLREDSGYTIKDVAHQLDATPKTIEDWEKRRVISLNYEQIKRLAKLYDVPLTNFFLPEPPPYKPLPFLRRGEVISVSPKVHKIKRKAYYLRSIIYEIDKENIKKIKDRIPHYSINEDPEECAKKEIERFRTIKLTRREDILLRTLKQRLAEIGVYTFELTMPLEEVRGFSIVDELPYIIVINFEDSIKGKIFTLLHEYAHILLRESSGCTEMELVYNSRKIEYWCNRFAASFLIPLSEIEIREVREVGEVDKLLEDLSNKYSISKYAIALRILTLNQEKLRPLQQIIGSLLIDKLREESKENISKRDEERYLFTWEDIPSKGIKIPDRLAKFLKVEDMLYIRKADEDKIKIITHDNKVVGEIMLEEDRAILQYKDKEYELDIKKVDNKTNIYKPFYRDRVQRRRQQLGSYFIEKVIDAYEQQIITTADLLDYLQIKTKDLPKIIR